MFFRKLYIPFHNRFISFSHEIWKPCIVPQLKYYFSKYEASNLGRIRVVKDGHIMKFQNYRDLPGLHLIEDETKRRKKMFVHRLICSVFHGPPPLPNYQTFHKNGIKTDARAENLEWISPSNAGKVYARRNSEKKFQFRCNLGIMLPLILPR